VNIYARAAVTTVSDVSFASYSSGISQLEAAAGGTLGDLYYPSTLTPSSPDVPAVVVIHGGGGNNGDKQDSREVEAAQELAARGWFVISINYAMSSSTVQCWPYNVWDAKQAVRWLKQKADAGTYAIDKNRIGVVGFSWGCNMGSMLAMTGPADDVGVTSSTLKIEPPSRGDSYETYSTGVQCSAVFYGAADLPNYHQMNQFLDKTAWSDRATYRRASPINYPNPSAAPMLVVHGSADDDVWQSQTESTYQMQRSVGATLEPYLQVPGGEHSFGLYETSKVAVGFPNPLDVRPETLGFMEKYLVESSQRPAMIVEPLSSIVNAGATATFSVQAAGSPAPTFQWRKNGVNLGGATNASYSVEATPTSAGYYDAVVTNSEGALTTTAGLLTLIGTSTNLPPSAVNDSAITTPGNPVTVSVLTNDSDGDGGVLALQSTTQGSNGTVTNTSSTVTYTPNDGFTGSDSFHYTITDGQGDTDSATVNITVTAGSTQSVIVSASATIESNNPTTDVDEVMLGYVSTKYSATGAKRKAYFQFDLGTLAINSAGTATLTLHFTNSFLQNVQLWALNQSDAGFTSAITWNTAQANDTTGNGMLAGATAIGIPKLIPSAHPNAETFTIPNIGSYVLDGKVTLVLTGMDHDTNNSSGVRVNRSNASLLVPVAGSANHVPTISDITNRTIAEDAATSVIAFTIGDAETAPGELILSASSSNTNKVPLAGIVLGGSGANRTVQVTPAPNEVGQSTVTITVTDASGASGSDSFVITITSVNDAPGISDLSNQGIGAGSSTGALAFTIMDVETSPAALAVTGISSDQMLVLDTYIVFDGSEGNRTVTVTLIAKRIGSAVITVTVADASLSASDSFTLSVTAPPTQTWWFEKFGTTDLNAAPHEAGADSDNDGGSNLLEYSQGSNPLLADNAHWTPVASLNSNVFRLSYRKYGTDLIYEVQRNSAPTESSNWLPVSSPEVDNGNGTYTVETPVSLNADFLRLKVTTP